MEYFHPCSAKAQDQAEPNRRSDNFAREWEVNSYSVDSVLCGVLSLCYVDMQPKGEP